MDKRIFPVFVNYRDYSMMQAWLSSQSDIPDYCQVVIVDNTESHLRDVDALRRMRRIPNVTVLEAENLGYLGALRFALSSSADMRQADFVFICNTDLDFNLKWFAEHLLEIAPWVVDNRVGVIAPQLVATAQRATRQMHLNVAPAAKRMARLARIFSSYQTLALYKIGGDVKRRFASRHTVRRALVDGESIFAPHGALMIFSRAYVQSEAAFDFPCFLFGEEIFVGLHSQKLGLRCVYNSSIRYSHKGHASMGNWPSRKVARYLFEAHEWAARSLAEVEQSTIHRLSR